MDGQRFDELAKAFATGVSRRQVIRGLVGGLFGRALAATGASAATAQSACPRGTVRCPNEDCVDLRTNPNHCGRCGQACAAGQACHERLSVWFFGVQRHLRPRLLQRPGVR